MDSSSATQAEETVALPPCSSYDDRPEATPRDRVLNGSLVMMAGLGLVTSINFAYNIAVARFLGPTAYGHTTAVYTLLILISAVTLSFQIITAKMVALQDSVEGQDAVYRGLHHRAWIGGIVVGLLLLLFRNTIANYLNLPTPELIVLLAAGAAFYVPLGARRGYMQGVCSFHRLAVNLILEGTARLGGSLLAIKLGWGVTGVIGANAAAVALAYLMGFPRLASTAASKLHVLVAFREALQAIVFFAGQVVINNCDIVVVKHFFPSELAGLYAAVALVGRVIFAFSWAVVSSMFPIAAGTRGRKRDDDGVLLISLVLVLAIGLVLSLCLYVVPAGLWTLLFGARFGMSGTNAFAHLLILYAATTSIYVFSVVLIAYEMSHKIANTGWVQLGFGVLVIGGIYLFHSSLAQVIWVQIIIMVLLLTTVALPFLRTRTGRESAASEGNPRGGRHQIKLLRPVSENEVILEFLRNDFQRPEFDAYQAEFARIVANPNLDDANENAQRRILLFVRHGSLWRQIPRETRWYEVQVAAADLENISVFPRAQWRKLARGNFAATAVVRNLAAKGPRAEADETFLSKLRELREVIRLNRLRGTILLIGEDDSGPFTILDGNHRFVAAMLESPATVEHCRFFCGLSPTMHQCCWYETNFRTLVRYGANLLRYLTYDPEAELRLLQPTTEPEHIA